MAQGSLATARPRGTEGAALIEAAVALSVLLTLLVGASYVQRLYLARQSALIDARRCAFLYAAAGCGDERPTGCDGVLEGTDAPSSDPDADAITASIRDHQSSTALDVLEQVPVLSAAIAGLFGTKTRALATRQVRSPFQAEDDRVLSGGVVLLCNERPIDPVAAAKAVMCSKIPMLAKAPFHLCEAK